MAQFQKPSFRLTSPKTGIKRLRNIAVNTASAAEFLAETVRAESCHFAQLAVAKVTTRLTGYVPQPHRDASLEPLAGVAIHSAGVIDDPLSRLA